MGDRVRVSVPSVRDLSRYVTSHPGQLSLAIPSWVDIVSTSQRAMKLCGWEVKAGMVRVCVWSPCYTRAISERLEMRSSTIKRHTNSRYITYFLYHTILTRYHYDN